MSCSSCRKRAPPYSKNSAHAVGAISQLAFNHPDNQAKIVEAGGIEALVKVAKEGSPKDEVAALKALGYVWGGNRQSSAKARLLDSEAVRVLIEMLQNSTDEGKEQAASLIARLVQGDTIAQSAVATCGAIPILVELGNNQNHIGSRIGAVKALKELQTNNPENAKLIEEAGGEPLVNKLMNTGMTFRELSEEDQLRMQAATEEDVNKPLVGEKD